MEVNKIYTGKCEEVLKDFPDNYFDSIVTDPPYGISFMNKHWDYQIPTVGQWKEIIRVLKPGGHLLCACGTRTQHRMVVNIEDAGFEIRDIISWIYGSGFPKSLDISKAIDKHSGAERGRIKLTNRSRKSDGGSSWRDMEGRSDNIDNIPDYIAITDEAKLWDGWGTALKPAQELWTLARKPISENTIAENVLKHGTGGINIDASRIEFKNEEDKDSATWGRGTDILSGNYVGAEHGNGKENIEANPKGRFPANVIFDEFTGKVLDEQTGVLSSGSIKPTYNRTAGNKNCYGSASDQFSTFERDSNTGGASRFFYCAKADRSERNKGLKGEGKYLDEGREVGSAGGTNPRNRGAETKRQNHHPTVKPIDLMRYLVKLITPKGAVCLDPFCGSGTTLIGCKLEKINYVGIDMNEEYCKIGEARVSAWNPEKYLSQELFI